MALPPAVAAQVFTSALGQIRGNPGAASIGAITNNVRSKFAADPPQPYFSYLNVVRQAIRAAQSALYLMTPPGVALAGFDHPVVPSTSANGEGFEYRIVVIADPGDGSEPFRTAVTVTAARPLSEAELLQRGIDAYTSQSFERDYRNEVAGAGSSPAISIEVISAGRTA